MSTNIIWIRAFSIYNSIFIFTYNHLYPLAQTHSINKNIYKYFYLNSLIRPQPKRAFRISVFCQDGVCMNPCTTLPRCRSVSKRALLLMYCAFGYFNGVSGPSNGCDFFNFRSRNSLATCNEDQHQK